MQLFSFRNIKKIKIKSGPIAFSNLILTLAVFFCFYRHSYDIVFLTVSHIISSSILQNELINIAEICADRYFTHGVLYFLL